MGVPPYKDSPTLKTAEMARARKDLPQAIHDYRQVIQENPQCEKAYIGLGTALFESNAIDEAKQTFEKALTLFPKSASAFIGMGAVYLALNQPENAVKSFDCALAINHCDAKAFNGRGIALDMLDDPEGAQENYQAAIKLDPANLSYKSNFALSMALAGKIPEAIHELELLSRSSCATPRIRQNLSIAYGLAGDMKMAKTIGEMDLPETIVRSNIDYMRSIRKTKKYSGLIPDTHTTPLNEGRTWQEID